MLLWSRCGSRGGEVGHFVGVEDGEGGFGEVCDDGVAAGVGGDGGEVEAAGAFGFRVGAFGLFGHPADCQAQAVLVGCEEFVATVRQRVCVPLFASSHADLGLASRGTVLLATFADQCDHIASLLVLLGLL